MAKRYLTTYSAPNILRNGGFETGDADFWIVSSKSKYEVVKTEEVDSAVGCLNYFKTIIPGTDPAMLEQSFMSQLGEYTDIAPNAPRMDVVLGLTDTDGSLKATDGTLGVSIRVTGGVVALYGIFNIETTSVERQEAVEMSPNVFSGEWKRFVSNVDMDIHESLTSVGIQVQRISGTPEINIGNFQFIEGKYTAVPYTGCMFSQAFVKGSFFLSMGRVPPPGFEVAYESEKFFIKDGDPNETGGSEHHEHEIKQFMADHTEDGNNDDWYKRAFLGDENILGKGVETADELVQIDSGERSHEHDCESPGGASSENTIPLWKGYVLCRKK